jgi:hypothetical protein
MRNMKHHVILGLTAFVLVSLTAAAQAEQFKVLTASAGKITPGTTAFVDTVNTPRVIEIDSSGKVVWQCSLAAAPFRGGDISKGADLEWVSKDDTFLVVIPLHGIFRIDRKCSVTWRHLTAKVSHDADSTKLATRFAGDEPRGFCRRWCASAGCPPMAGCQAARGRRRPFPPKRRCRAGASW